VNLPLIAAKAHHIPPEAANALGWVVLVVIIAVPLAWLLRRLGVLR